MSTMNLNDKYFECVASYIPNCVGSTDYIAYRCIYDSIILYSSNYIPICVVSLKSSSPTKALIIPKCNEEKEDFHGIITKNNQEFQFIITNLCSMGNVKIDIMKNNKAVNCVDPGSLAGAINQVNELHPYQSYEVTVDQMTGCTMILSSLKDNKKSRETGKNEEIEGTYVYVAVTPQFDKQSLVDLFKSTKWIKDNMFVLTHNERIQPETIYRGMLATPTSCTIANGDSDYDDEEEENVGILEETSKPSSLITTESDSDIIGQSQKACVRIGKQTEVVSYHTGIDYKYDVDSNQTDHLCCISLSVNENVHFIEDPISNNWGLMGMKLIGDYQKKCQDKMVKIYTQEECSICLEKGIDSVFYECGHACCHLKCIGNQKLCPLCRQPIIAVLRK